MGRNSGRQAFPLLFFTFFVWGSIYVAGKMISDDIPASLVACLHMDKMSVPDACQHLFPVLPPAAGFLGPAWGMASG